MWRMIIFGTVASLIWGGAHVYAGWSLARFLRSKKAKRVLWGLLAGSFAVTLAASILRRTAPEMAMAGVLQWVAYLAMGSFALLLFLVVARDLGLLTFGAMRRWVIPPATSRATSDDGPEDPSRRELFRHTVNASIVGVAASGTGLGYHEARKLAEVVEVDVAVEGLTPQLDGLRIAQISDIHVGPTIKRDYLQAVVDRVNGLEPDLIALTGDMVDGYVDDMRNDVAPIGDLQAPLGAYFVPGNHEYYWDGPAWCDEVERCGMQPLINSHRVVEVDGARLLVGGVTDYRAGARVDGHTSDPHKALEGAPEADFRLLLAHQPKSVWEAAKAGFDLQLSGHTHGGQFWPWSLFVGLAHPFTRGLNDYEDMKIYVSRGTGYWGPPLRLGVPSEITLLTLRRKT
jgi:hypothetical protein